MTNDLVIEVMDIDSFKVQAAGTLEIIDIDPSPNGYADVRVNVLAGGIETLLAMGYEDEVDRLRGQGRFDRIAAL